MGHWVHFEGPNETPKVPKWGSAHELKGQLGAGQLGSGDQNTNEEKQLLWCEPPFGATSVTARKWKQESTRPGSRDLCTARTAPVHTTAATLDLLNPSAAGCRALLSYSPQHPCSPDMGSRRV